MADFLNSSEKRFCILILISIKYFKKVRIKIPKLNLISFGKRLLNKIKMDEKTKQGARGPLLCFEKNPYLLKFKRHNLIVINHFKVTPLLDQTADVGEF